MKVGHVQQQINDAQQRQTTERETRWTEFAKRQDELLAEKVPELADKEKGQKLQTDAVEVLRLRRGPDPNRREDVA